eukprot:TRINITY_DN9567_c0_g1_i6.p1 TRINITY_DN9567_c0_g1~~TRINITY_DN9567_c0_g1_i6.p1  ORF type:complete len:203 (+),score=40.69 TRINITY_DN9567_c0_g1_i6:663-1271(+)
MKAKVKSTPEDMKAFERVPYAPGVDRCNHLATTLKRTLVKANRIDAALSLVADASAELAQAVIIRSTEDDRESGIPGACETLAHALTNMSKVRDLQNESFSCHLASQPLQNHHLLTESVNRVTSDRQSIFAACCTAVGSTREDQKKSLGQLDEDIAAELEVAQGFVLSDTKAMLKQHVAARKMLIRQELEHWDKIEQSRRVN